MALRAARLAARQALAAQQLARELVDGLALRAQCLFQRFDRLAQLQDLGPQLLLGNQRARCMGIAGSGQPARTASGGSEVYTKRLLRAGLSCAPAATASTKQAASSRIPTLTPRSAPHRRAGAFGAGSSQEGLWSTVCTAAAPAVR